MANAPSWAFRIQLNELVPEMYDMTREICETVALCYFFEWRKE